MWSNSLSQISIKFKVAPSAYNVSVVAFLGIGIYPILLHSSSYADFFIVCNSRTHEIIYVCSCMWNKIFKTFSVQLWTDVCLYQEFLFNQSGLLLWSISYFISSLENIIHNTPTCVEIFPVTRRWAVYLLDWRRWYWW